VYLGRQARAHRSIDEEVADAGGLDPAEDAGSA
jgi:hypothetical protein